MTDTIAAPRTLSHQGKHLRLSLPVNDDRSQGFKSQAISADADAWDLESSVEFQTISVLQDPCDEADMRVICSVADRIQWDQRVQQVKERKLQELGVGVVSNTSYNVPILSKRAIPVPHPVEKSAFWTGLHTPAVSTDSAGSIHGTTRAQNKLDLSSLLGTLSTVPDQDALLENVATLRARHRHLSKSVSELAKNTLRTSLERTLSQRDLVHAKLGSIAPVCVKKNGLRVVSGIGPISEEIDGAIECDPESSTYTPGANSQSGPIAAVSTLHAHLASHDMSELIKPHCAPRQHLQGDLYMPDFNRQYESFSWADEPMDCESPVLPTTSAFSQYPSNNYASMQYNHVAQSGFAAPELELFMPFQPQECQALYFPSQIPVQSTFAQYLPQEPAPTPAQEQSMHVPHQSSLNLRAEAFVPTSQVIVKPRAGSSAIPIVRPPEACPSATDNENLSKLDDQHDISISYQTESTENTPRDAYEGFNSGSETSSIDRSSPLCEEDIMVEVDTNEERVKSFIFPSPVKQATPSRSRTGLFISPSPEGRQAQTFSNLAPPRLESTPRKSPRIFQKSVELEDTELDSIIMDLSIRQYAADHEKEGSTVSEDASEVSSTDLLGQSPSRPQIRRVSSAKLLLSHQDADMGLLLDAMLSAKFAGVTDMLSGLMKSVDTIQDQLNVDAMEQARSQEMVDRSISTEKMLSVGGSPMRTALPVARNGEQDAAQHAINDDRQLPGEHSESDPSGYPDPGVEQKVQISESLDTTLDRLRVLTGAKTALQKCVGEMTAKAARLEGQLLDSTTFCSALQSQYSTSELALTKLRKQLRDTQFERDQAILNLEKLTEMYECLKRDLEQTASAVAEEQSRWREVEEQKNGVITQLKEKLSDEQRRKDSVSSGNLTHHAANSISDQLNLFLMDRIKALELSNQSLQTSHQQDLQVRETRIDQLMQEWKDMTRQLSTAEATIDGLRAEIVMNADVEDRLSRDLQKSEQCSQALAAQVRKGGPVGILKRSKSASEVRDDQQIDQMIVQLTAQLKSKDARIAELEELLTKPAESTERQIMFAISENISRPEPVTQETEVEPDVKSEPLSSRVAELKRMRISWELKHAPSVERFGKLMA